MVKKAVALKNSFYLKLVLPKDDAISYSKILGSNRRHKRSNTAIKEDAKALIIEINAMDLAALRASFNSISRNVQVIKSTKVK